MAQRSSTSVARGASAAAKISRLSGTSAPSTIGSKRRGSGPPVVASPLPEVVAVGDLVRIAATAEEFATAIEAALEDAADAGAAKRWASQHGWSSRADQLRSELGKVWPKVSVIIVAYNKA